MCIYCFSKKKRFYYQKDPQYYYPIGLDINKNITNENIMEKML